MKQVTVKRRYFITFKRITLKKLNYLWIIIMQGWILIPYFDKNATREEALVDIYRVMRPGELRHMKQQNII